MRIAHVSEHASPLAALGGVDAGGQNVHVAALALALAGGGHHVDVYTRRDDPSLPDRVPMAARVTVHHLDAGPAEPVPKDELLDHMPEFARGLTDRLAAARYDVVHTHFWMSGWAGLQARTALGIPLVHTFHALGVVKRRHHGPRDPSPPARLGHEVELARQADRIVATCTDEVTELAALGAARSRVSVVPCGVDVQRFTPVGGAEPRRHGLRRLVTVGRLVERKGVDDAIRALALLDGTELVVAGGPGEGEFDRDPEVVRLRALAAAEGVADRVEFRGRVDHDDVPALLRSADVVLCVPWYEPFGIVPLEAMACGVPVVATGVGGMLDTVSHGCTGLHVPPRRPDRVADAVRRLFADDGERRRMGAEGQRRARRTYGWEHVAAATLDVYHDVVGEAAGNRRVARHGQAVAQ